MKKIFVIAILCLYSMGCQKPKEQPAPTPTPTPRPVPPPTVVTYKITASAGNHGSISPGGVDTTIQLGSNISYSITPDSGYNINAINIDGVNILTSIITGPYSYDFSKINANHTINVGFTDSLTSDQMDSLIFYQKGKWHDVKIEYKVSGSNFTTWYNFPISSCAASDYTVYNSDFSYYARNNHCAVSDTAKITDSGKWSFSANGKVSYILRPDGTKDSVLILKLTADSNIVIYSASNHYDYKYYDTH